MPDERHTDDHVDPRRQHDRDAISEGTSVKLSLVISVIGVLLVVAAQWWQLQGRVTELDYRLQAAIIGVRSDAEKASDAADRVQDSRLAKLENKLEQVRVTNCAIAQSLKVPTVGCGRAPREDDP